jgi:putative aldouronate transport system substrate-binding protein
VRVFTVNNRAALPGRGENQYWQEVEKRLGVTWEANLVPSDATVYSEKLAVLTASGDLPDLVLLQPDLAPEQLKIISQGAYTDLTPYLTGEALKEYPNLAAFPPQVWSNMAIKGKIYGVPRPRFLTGGVLLFRKDWAEKMGNPNPKNADEFFKLMQDFAKKDPDGNGQADSWAYGYSNAPSLPTRFSWLMGMFRVPNQWKLETNGELVYFIETAEFREAIAFFRKMWEAELVYPDSLTQGVQEQIDRFIAGKYGMHPTTLTGLPGPTGRRAAIKKVNPAADVIAFVPPGHDGGKGTHWLGTGYLGFTAIPSKVGRDKERIKELLQILNYLASPFGSEEYTFLTTGLDGVHNDVAADGSRVLNDKGRKEIGAGDLVGLTNIPPVLYYPGYPDQPALIQNNVKQLLEIGVADPTQAATSATWNSNGKVLEKLVDDRITRILTGRDALSSIDDLVKEWRSRGGSQVAKEFATSLK